MKRFYPESGLQFILWFALAAVLILWVPFFKSLAGAGQDTIHIGVILPLSGPHAVNGEAAKRGIDLAVADRTAQLQRLGRDVRVIFADDRMEPEESVRVAEKLVTADKVISIIGPFSSAGVLAVAPIAEREKGVLVSGSATSPGIRDAGDFIFRTVSADTFHGKALSRFAFAMLRARKAAILYLDNEYGRGLKDAIAGEFARLGGKIVFAAAFNPGETDFKSTLEKLKRLDLHGIFLPAYPVDGGRILKQADAMNFAIPFLGGDGLFSPDLLDAVKETKMEVYASAASWRVHSPATRSQEFVKNFQEAYGTVADVYSAYYFDAVDVVLQAMTHDALTAEQIQRYLLDHAFEGVTGKIHFDRNGEVSRPIDIFKIENKQFEYFFTVQP